MEVEYFELDKMGECHGDVGEHVGRQVELDQVGALGHSGQFRGLDVGAGQDEQLERRGVLDKLADLQFLFLFILRVFLGLHKV